MTTTTPTSTKPKRRWLRFSLRTFLVGMLLLGCGLGWVGMQLQQKRRHEAVVKEIERLGGVVWGEGFAWSSSWEVWLFGDYEEWLFGDYTAGTGLVNLADTDATDSLLAQMKGMDCWLLELSSTNITDAGLTHLKGMTGLKELYLIDTLITDAGLESLQGLNSLEKLYLESSSVTPQGVEKLQKALPNCDIQFTPIETTSDPTSP